VTTRRRKSQASDEPSPSADWKKLVEEWVRKRFGLAGVVVLAVVFALIAIWWQWDQIVKLPGIAEMVKLASRAPLPRADPQRFSVAVAHLEGDANSGQEQNLVDSLWRFAATEQGSSKLNVQILQFDRTIELKGGDLEIEASKGHEAARRLLAESGADVLLWGRVLKEGNQTRPRLFWTPARAAAHGKATDLYAVQEFELPPVFWTDLAQWLGLLVESQAAELNKLEGQYAAGRLLPFIERTRKVLDVEARSWDADTRARVQFLLANALRIYGEQAGTRQPLEEAVATFQEALKERTRDRVPLDWAQTQTALGDALWRLGEREAGTARLEAAVAAYQEALKERTRERVPLDWAATQNSLGNALWRLGERETGTARLEAAVAAYQEALKECTRELAPLDWAATQNNLGNALLRLGERETGTARLEAAVAAYQEALKEWTRERVPLDWALAQNNLGLALFRLGERETGTARLKAAVAVYQGALKERTRERVPLDWAQTQNNLGLALMSLGVEETDTARLEAAVAVYQEALKERTRERVPLDWAQTQNNLGLALMSLGLRETGTARLEAAVAAYQEAFKEWTRERVPPDWALTQDNLGLALESLGVREASTTRLEAAVTAYQEALQVWRGTNDYRAMIARINLLRAQAALDNMRANQR
jgi:tetratricopeptide (TPR) repeat protein